MYPQNQTGEGRGEQALRADDVGSRNTGHEMYRQEGPRQQKGSGRDGSKCEHVGSRAQRGKPTERTVRNQVESLEPPVSLKLHIKEEAADQVGGLAQGPRTGPRK